MTEADWLRQIAADRDNDTLRLISADWLEEHGEAARAEFIRVQIHLAALPEKAPEYWELRKRESDLLREHRAVWLRDVWVAPRSQCVFRRGFVDEISGLAASPHLARLATLRLAHNRIGDVGMSALASSPYLARLTRL